MNENIINDIYVELDGLVDTRLSMMYDIDKNVMRGLIEANKYHTRVNDQFGYLSAKLFRLIYGMRNSVVLDNPSGTEVINVISEYCLESTLTAKSYGEYKQLTIHLNIYPYNITEENLELIRMGLFNSTKMNVNIEIVNKPFQEVTPLWMKENIGLAIMYDGVEWIEHFLNNKELLNYSIPDTTLITPMLVHRNVMIAKREMPKFFEDMEKSVGMLVNLVYVPSKVFSFIPEEYVKEKKKEDT